MNDLIFPILGSEDPPMVGRQKIMQRVWADLTKATPSNLSIVGPRHIGKTVFLKALAERAKQDDSPYALVFYAELGHAPPTSDDDFITALCDLMREVMGVAGADYSGHREYLEEDKSYGSFKEVMDLLDMEEKPVLMIWDGFDKPLGQGHLTGHLFGQMRDIFHGKKHKIVTATRATQSELARNRQVYDSEFWNLFDVNAVRLTPFDAEDHAAALSKTGLTASAGGEKELLNWAGGYPPLLLSLLNRLAARGRRGMIDNEAVNSEAMAVCDELTDLLNRLWCDCSASAKDVYRLLVERGELAATDVGREEAAFLTTSGFAVRTANKLKPACRMLQAHVRNDMPDAGSMVRLFGTWETYRREIRHVLELRLGQIPVVNNRLHRLVAQSIQDIPEFPDDCLNNLTQIEDQALDVVLDHEFGENRLVPNDLLEYWKDAGHHQDRTVSTLAGQATPTVPGDRFLQCGILQLLTGSKRNLESKAKSVSKSTYVLLNALHSFRNRTQHVDGEQTHVGVAVAAITTCLELLACLHRELSQ